MDENKPISMENNKQQLPNGADSKSSCSSGGGGAAGKEVYNRPASVNAPLSEEMMTPLNPYKGTPAQQQQSQAHSNAHLAQQQSQQQAQQHQQQRAMQNVYGYLGSDQANYYTLQPQGNHHANANQSSHQSSQMLMNSPSTNYIQTPTGEILPVSGGGQYATSQPLLHSNLMSNYVSEHYNPAATIGLHSSSAAQAQMSGVMPHQQTTYNQSLHRGATQYDHCPTVCSLFAIFCCPITCWCSLTALVYSMWAYTDYRAEDMLQYRRKSDKARQLVISACIIGLLVCVLWATLTFVYYADIISFLQAFVQTASNKRWPREKPASQSFYKT